MTSDKFQQSVERLQDSIATKMFDSQTFILDLRPGSGPEVELNQKKNCCARLIHHELMDNNEKHPGIFCCELVR